MARESNIEKRDAPTTGPPHLVSGSGVLRPKARILRTFGDELISSETVAIMELVKNSYDADATRVLVRFHDPLEIGAGRIEVIDNGHGMSLETIRSTWMEPATLMRKRERRSRQRRRRVLGEKGIGRFATSRLADYLEVVTRNVGADREIRVLFDWAQFDDEAKYLDQVEVLWEEANPSEIAHSGVIERLWDLSGDLITDELTHGTILRMEGLRTDWDTSNFKDLRTSLSRLVSPFFGEEMSNRNDEFEVRLDLPTSFEQQSGIVEAPELLRNPHYSLKGLMDAQGKYELTLRLREGDGEVPIRGEFKPNNHEPECGPMEIELRVWDRDQASMSDLMEHHSFETVPQVRSELDAATGISIYRDGFRVLPYGEPNNDWLRLDLRRVQNPTLRLSNNQVMGYVLIRSDTNPGLKDQSNREGLIESRSLVDLREFIKVALNELELRRYSLRRETSPHQPRRPRRRGGLFADFDLVPVRQYVRENYPDDRSLTALVGEAEKDLATRAQSIQEVISRYQRLATLGQLVDIVLHDGRAPLTKISNEVVLGLRDVERAGTEGVGLIKQLGTRFKTIANQSEALATVFRRIEPFGGRKRGRPGSVPLEEVIANAFSVLDTEIAEVGVALDLPQTDTKVTVDQTEVQEVIINLLQNSLYWLRQAPVDSRQVTVQVCRKAPGEVEVVFSDSGPGVPQEFREIIFDPYISTKTDGVGLGLTIAGEIVTDYYGGVLELMEGGPLQGASFRFTLCRRV